MACAYVTRLWISITWAWRNTVDCIIVRRDHVTHEARGDNHYCHISKLVHEKIVYSNFMDIYSLHEIHMALSYIPRVFRWKTMFFMELFGNNNQYGVGIVDADGLGWSTRASEATLSINMDCITLPRVSICLRARKQKVHITVHMQTCSRQV